MKEQNVEKAAQFILSHWEKTPPKKYVDSQNFSWTIGEVQNCSKWGRYVSSFEEEVREFDYPNGGVEFVEVSLELAARLFRERHPELLVRDPPPRHSAGAGLTWSWSPADDNDEFFDFSTLWTC